MTRQTVRSYRQVEEHSNKKDFFSFFSKNWVEFGLGKKFQQIPNEKLNNGAKSYSRGVGLSPLVLVLFGKY